MYICVCVCVCGKSVTVNGSVFVVATFGKFVWILILLCLISFINVFVRHNTRMYIWYRRMHSNSQTQLKFMGAIYCYAVCIANGFLRAKINWTFEKLWKSHWNFASNARITHIRTNRTKNIIGIHGETTHNKMVANQ